MVDQWSLLLCLQEETEAEELLKPQSPTVDLQTERYLSLLLSNSDRHFSWWWMNGRNMSENILYSGSSSVSCWRCSSSLFAAMSSLWLLCRRRWTGTVEPAVQRARLFIMCVSVLLVLGFVATGISLGDCNLFSIKTFWTGARVTLQPYCSVHYGDMPPLWS